jgi:hypothetical protein
MNRHERRFHLMIEQSRPLTRTHRAIASALEPVREHIESSESFVIQGRRPDSLGGADVDEQESRTL